MNRLRASCLSLLLVLGFTPDVSAHHSLSMYDRQESRKISGTLKQFDWSNPHVHIYLTVLKDDGSVEDWNFEGPGPNGLERSGWTKDTLRVGDTLTVAFNPMRDGTPGGLFQEVTAPDGTVYSGRFAGPGPFRGAAPQFRPPPPAI